VLAQQSEIIRQQGGYIDKFAGDGLMAVFAEEGHVDSACAAALEIITWCQKTPIPGLWKEIPLASGLHTGPVLRGIMGGESRREFTIMGHVVNMAARVCGIANLHEVLVTDAVVAALGTDLACGPNREKPLKGMNVPVRVRTLLATEL
jgi:class 3 adenylate cyclase